MLINNLIRASAIARRLSSVAKRAYRPLEVMLKVGSTNDSRTVIESVCQGIKSAGIEASGDTPIFIFPPKGGILINDLEQIICCPRCRSQLGPHHSKFQRRPRTM